jgi:glycosyltransferase involved in cell wall biosynthesis
MNIVLLSDSGVINGGAVKIALDGAIGLAAAGHQVHLVCGAGGFAKQLQGVPGLTLHRVSEFDIVEDSNRLRAMAFGWWNPRAHKYMSDLMETFDPEDTIVHVHSWTKALSSSAIRAALDGGFETVVTIHDFLLACPTGTLFRQDKLEKCHIQPMSLQCICTNCDAHSYQHKLWRVGRRLIQNNFGGIPSRIRNYIVYSQLAEDLLKPLLPDESVFHMVPNSIEMERNSPANVAANDAFTFLGRITPEKGVEIFARAAAAEKVPCRFIGEGPALDMVLHANPDAILSGWMDQRAGMLALREARALVFPSLWYETLGLVVLEAAGNGVPSIVPDTCAARESVVDGETGLYFRSGDEADLRRKIAILKDPAVAAKMGAAAYHRFWQPPGRGLKLHGSRLEATYKQILSARFCADINLEADEMEMA